jgi:phage host-nuclease inhibitor protein Gam
VEEANDALKEIALRNIELARIDADAEEAIAKIKEEAEKRAAPLKHEIEEYGNGLANFAEANRVDLFKKKKSIDLVFGQFGYRQSTSIRVKSVVQAVQALKGLGHNEAILVKETVNKEALRTFSDAELAKVHCSRKVKDDFWYEVAEEEITRKPN